MPQISLTHEESESLQSILQEVLSDLRMEIADTDSMDFREALKRKKQLLQDLLERLAVD